MIKYENECCDCAVPAYPCLGEACNLRHVKHLYCDTCKDDVGVLYLYDGQELCIDCLLKCFEYIN